jgi:hypothetical protein
MYASKIGESCLTTGTGSYQFSQTAVGSFRTWRTGFATGAAAFYYATSADGDDWELGYGTFTTGSPYDQLTRNVLASSSGGTFDWVTTPFRVYNTTAAEAEALLGSPLISAVSAVPAWLSAGFAWLDYSLGLTTAWIKKRYISGTVTTATNHAEEGRHYLGLTGAIANIFAGSGRKLFVDKGAADYTLTADDVDKVLCFNCTAAVRTLTALVGSATGIGHGFTVHVYPYSTTIVNPNGMTFTPAGGDTTDLATAPAGLLTTYRYDANRTTWVTDYLTPATQVLRSYLAGLTLSAAGGTGTFGIAAGVAADSTNVSMMALASAYTKTTATWAVGSGNGGLDTGAIANSTWYHVWLIQRTGTGVVDVLFSTSATTPTMPTNYTLKRRIGSMKTDGSAQWVKFTQNGDEFLWDAPVLDLNGTAPPTSASSATLTVPTGVKVNALLCGNALGQAGGNAVMFSSLDMADTAPAIGGIATITCNNAVYMAWAANVRTNTSAQIRQRSSSITSLLVYATTLGWIDRRGRDT